MYTYKIVEKVLSRVLRLTKPDEMSAFQARLKHLRSLGIPQSERPGSGAKIWYTRVHAAQMLVAMRLESLGCSPRVSAHGADIATPQLAAAQRGGSDLFLVVHPQKGCLTMRLEQLDQAIRGWAVCGILNLSLTIRELEAALSVAEND
jgi:hypothetical protein